MTRARRLVGVAVVAALFGFLGLFFALGEAFLSEGRVVAEPAPYRVALMPDGTALRVAMVYDVVHQRFPRHGPAWSEAVVARSIARVEQTEARDPAALFEPASLEAFDDWGVALDRLGRADEAISVLRRKKALVERRWPRLDFPPKAAADAVEAYIEVVRRAGALTPAEQAWYRTYANLGTVLVHQGLRALATGDAEGRGAVAEGLGFVRQAVRLNPAAHFGRERWQLVVARHVRAGLDDPTWFTRFSAIGWPLDAPPPKLRPTYRALPAAVRDLVEGASHDLGERWTSREAYIPRVVPEPEWAEVTGADFEGAPFDEPVLGLLGMWMLGGGANPHSALALGQIMEAMEQRPIAYAAYARALAMKDRFSPDAGTVRLIEALVRGRMADIAGQIDEDEASLQAAVTVALAEGEAFQQAQADFEAARAADGADVLDPAVQAAFLAGCPPIASKPGQADTVFIRRGTGAWRLHRLVMWVTLWAAAGAWLAVWVARRRARLS